MKTVVYILYASESGNSPTVAFKCPPTLAGANC